MTRFVVNDRRTVDFVTKANGIGDGNVNYSIGVERNGEVVAGILYCDNNGTSVCMHVASKPGVNWVTRAFLKLVFGFAFNGLGVKRITGFVPETNAKARKFDEHLGFKLEVVLRDIYADGGLCIYAMRKEDCRFV